MLNSYLVQLLDNGFLHADPHPGNFLLQDDGTLCVLDFGLMTEVYFFSETALPFPNQRKTLGAVFAYSSID